MKVLHLAAGLPSAQRPHKQPFIKSQIDSLVKEGINCGVFDIESHKSRMEYIKSIRKIKKIVTDENYDLIHAHYSYCGLSAYFSYTDKPIVLSFMGSDLLGRPNANGEVNFRGKLDIMLSNFISKRVDHVIVKSLQMKGLLDSSIPSSVIPNGVDFKKFIEKDPNIVRKELGFEADDFIILFLGGRDILRKNFKLAQDSSNMLMNKLGDSKIKFVNPYGVAQDKIVDFLNAANVLLLTSFWEGSPNVIKEAMACNLPIISTEVGDVREIVKNAKNCFIVDYSVKEISDKLQFLYENRLRSNGRHKIESLVDTEIAKKIISIYEDILRK